ncbi:MAG TPA: (d)CMP kinase [Spirochaetota bacterium]|nr:(d)CMP kinase [Spirochaetota bacterium]HPQ53286.1 (d)CMP kinase [Spirochaetota bacterium]
MDKHLTVVAVDGPAGSGKSSVSREVAVALGLKYIDSGAIYRAITWFLIRRHGAITKGQDFSGDLNGVVITQEFNNDGSCNTFVDNTDVSVDIRTETIAKNIGKVSDDPGVREFVNGLLREWARNSSIIMDGRDIGTVVFPDADLKVYLDASVDVRAERRYNEYRESGKNVDLNSIKNQIIQRDVEDTSRPFGALKTAEDAVVIDTSSMSKEDVIQALINLIAPL